MKLNSNLSRIFETKSSNLSHQEWKQIKQLPLSRKRLTIKPAKNLGIVLLDMEDYVDQCLSHLSKSGYQMVSHFPTTLHSLLQNTIINFKSDLTYNIFNSKSLHHDPLPKSQVSYRNPQFYGLPKIHKKFTRVPLLRSIVSHSNSMLEITAKYLDFNLQPIARSYPDFIQNSTSLISRLKNMSTPKDSLLISLDTVNLYPSIPQDECLCTIYDVPFTMNR